MASTEEDEQGNVIVENGEGEVVEEDLDEQYDSQDVMAKEMIKISARQSQIIELLQAIRDNTLPNKVKYRDTNKVGKRSFNDEEENLVSNEEGFENFVQTLKHTERGNIIIKDATGAQRVNLAMNTIMSGKKDNGILAKTFNHFEREYGPFTPRFIPNAHGVRI